MYVKRGLFLPPVKGGPSATEAVVVIFPGIALAPEQYSEVAKAIQLEALASYNQSLYIVVAKFFNNLGCETSRPAADGAMPGGHGADLAAAYGVLQVPAEGAGASADVDRGGAGEAGRGQGGAGGRDRAQRGRLPRL